jgi:hypothetical protein
MFPCLRRALRAEGEFSCQEGVLLRIGRPLTVQQLITTKQNAGQCTAAVNKVWRRRQAQREYEVCKGGRDFGFLHKARV